MAHERHESHESQLSDCYQNRAFCQIFLLFLDLYGSIYRVKRKNSDQNLIGSALHGQFKIPDSRKIKLKIFVKGFLLVCTKWSTPG